jgi:hypothetical protein
MFNPNPTNSMENLTRIQSEALSRALNFYGNYFEGFQINWFKIKFTEDKLIFYCSNSFGVLFQVLVDFDKYIPTYITGIEPNGNEIYFATNRLELKQYLNK